MITLKSPVQNKQRDFIREFLMIGGQFDVFLHRQSKGSHTLFEYSQVIRYLEPNANLKTNTSVQKKNISILNLAMNDKKI